MVSGLKPALNFQAISHAIRERAERGGGDFTSIKHSLNNGLSGKQRRNKRMVCIVKESFVDLDLDPAGSASFLRILIR
jgi:hypothetical protein